MVIDPVQALTHDNADLNRRVLALGSQIRACHGAESASPLATPLDELREQLFLHFAREEEGLFPFVIETVPELGAPVKSMEIAHDTICGGLARMCELASTAATIAKLAPLFDRFESAHAEHARTEAELLARLDARLDAERRGRLAALVDGL